MEQCHAGMLNCLSWYYLDKTIVIILPNSIVNSNTNYLKLAYGAKQQMVRIVPTAYQTMPLQLK